MKAEAEAKKAAFEQTWDDGNLQGQAREIVVSEAKRQCVQAGPGTGKSYCMTKRLLRLIQEQHVQPADVLAVTFTRTAANDLRKALSKALGDQYSGFWASTLHSLCFCIVESQNFLRTRGRNPRFLLSVTKSGCLNFEGACMLSDLQLEDPAFGAARIQTKKIKEFEARWARRQDDPLGTPGNTIDAKYGTALLNWLRFHRGMMVGELVSEAYQYLSSEPESEWRLKFKAILVDEYQDLNKLDQSVIDLLCENPDTMCSVVGDLDQSIYSFRCAHPEGLQEYGQKDGVESTTMEVSRRCPTSHLEAAQSLIQQNTRNAGRYPVPMKEAITGQLSVRRWRDRAAEVQGIVKFVEHCYGNGVDYGEMLVMVPSRVIGKDIKVALNIAGIEAHSYFAEEQLEVEDAQKAFTLLALVADAEDRVALRCWLGGWSNGNRAASYAKVRRHCEEHNLSPSEVLNGMLSEEIRLPGVTSIVTAYKDLLGRIEALKKLSGIPLANALFPPDAEWSDDIRMLLGETIPEEMTSQEMRKQLVDSITQPVLPTEVSFVRVMSLHKSKGLTARASVIAGAVEGLIPRPHDPSKSFLTEAEHLEEQRRLFYVAMTRSTEHLLISSPAIVNSKFEFGIEIPGTNVGQNFRTTVSPYVTSLGNLPAAAATMTFP